MIVKKKKYKLKKQFRIVLLVLFAIILGICAYFYISYRLSNTYAFKKMGYNEKQVTFLTSLDENFQEKLLTLDYDPDLIKLIKQKYFIQSNFDRYLDYINKNKKVKYKDVVTLVNVNRDSEYYTNTKKTDVSKKELMLVNKYHTLDKYKPDNVEKIDLTYAYQGRQTTKEMMFKYKNMYLAAKNEGINIVINSAYRSYDNQKSVYDEYVDRFGEDYANDYAAHPGFSEHQTGYAFDLGKLDVLLEDFDKTDVFKWLMENSYKYGFILRYPKNKENITGFKYESWHYRYVGVEVATQIYKENITFDEYYAFYIENKGK